MRWATLLIVCCRMPWLLGIYTDTTAQHPAEVLPEAPKAPEAPEAFYVVSIAGAMAAVGSAAMPRKLPSWTAFGA